MGERNRVLLLNWLIHRSSWGGAKGRKEKKE